MELCNGRAGDGSSYNIKPLCLYVCLFVSLFVCLFVCHVSAARTVSAKIPSDHPLDSPHRVGVERRGRGILALTTGPGREVKVQKMTRGQKYFLSIFDDFFGVTGWVDGADYEYQVFFPIRVTVRPGRGVKVRKMHFLSAKGQKLKKWKSSVFLAKNGTIEAADYDGQVFFWIWVSFWPRRGVKEYKMHCKSAKRSKSEIYESEQKLRFFDEIWVNRWRWSRWSCLFFDRSYRSA